MRYCYADRMVAQTGNVEPVMQMTPEVESLFEYSDRFFKHAQTKWCAIDVLRDGDQWRLLETSDRPVDDISAAVGYEDASFFRRVFKRRTGLAPAQYRRAFKPVRVAGYRTVSGPKATAAPARTSR